MRSKKYLAYFEGWENQNHWSALDFQTGKSIHFSAKRMYRYRTLYILYVKKNKVVKTKRAKTKLPKTVFNRIIVAANLID